MTKLQKRSQLLKKNLFFIVSPPENNLLNWDLFFLFVKD